MTARADDDLFRRAVDRALVDFLAGQRPTLEPLGSDLAQLTASAGAFVAGGKRLRAVFCHAGWLVAGGRANDARVVTAAAAIEWLQASALVHDDLIDDSDTRRGRPSIHREFEALHRAERRHGDAAAFGRSAAVLLGDLMLCWSDELFRSAPPATPSESPWEARLRRSHHHLDLCRTEVVAGQFLDVSGQTRATLSVDEAMLVVRYKSAKYTVERPLHVGAALAGADDALLADLTEVALPLGEAFQLRDDVLGVFGDPAVTGKPTGDDLREGKRTVLVARAAELSDDAGRAMLLDLLGTAEGIEPLSRLIRECGALDAVERDIARLEAAADAAIERLPTPAHAVLRPIAMTATRRTR